MKKTEFNKLEDKHRWGLIGAIISAVIASVCCVGPFVLLLLGIGGAWAGSLTAFEPYRPVFVVIALGFLAYAFYKVYAKPKAEACDIESYCANPKSDRINKVILWIVTFIIIGLFIFPNILPYFQRAESVATTAQTERIFCRWTT